MRIGVLGGGAVGQTLAGGLRRVGHEVTLGIREVTPEALGKARNQAKPLGEWQAETGVRVVPYAHAAGGAELVVNATNGAGSLEALRMAGVERLSSKVLVDVSNPLDFSHGMPPSLLAEYTGATSLAERIQAEFPETRVVKAFNTVTARVMVEPSMVPGAHDLFVCGNDAGAKEAVRALARELGWESFADMGDLTGARAQEAMVLVWVALWRASGNPLLGYHVHWG